MNDAIRFTSSFRSHPYEPTLPKGSTEADSRIGGRENKLDRRQI
jgi:hypothetical protein